MPIGTATWESKKGQFYRFNMMDNVVFQQNGTQLMYHVSIRAKASRRALW